MIVETTYSDKANNQLINDLVGKSYSLFERFKMRGIGSKRMIISEASPNFQGYLNSNSDPTYANLELRPNGLLIRINKGLRNFTWAIPFYQLVIYKTNGSSIHAHGKFIHFKNNITFKENKWFFDKLLAKKVEFEKQFEFIGV